MTSFSIGFDYRFDGRGFFDDSDRREILELAANEWVRHINDEFVDIPVGSVFSVIDPDNPSQMTTVELSQPIDDILIFVGSNDQGGYVIQSDGSLRAQIGEAYSIYGGDGDALRLRTATDFRGLGPPTDFEPFTGSIAFNTNSDINWSFDPDGPIAGFSDLYSTAVHEIGHILGLVASPTFSAHIVGSSFTGINALAENGGSPIPLEADDHVLDGFAGDTVVMDPLELVGVRKVPGPIDLALLADIGYEIDGYVKQGSPFALTTPGDDNPVFGSQADDFIDGLGGDDQIQGAGGNDRLLGSGGFDILFGGSDNDVLDGGADDDQLQGNAGDDILVGGAGDDDLFGANGYDTYVFEGDWGDDFLLDPDSYGLLRFVGYEQSDLSLTQSGNNLLISTGANRVAFFDYYANASAYDFAFGASADTVGEGTDTSAALSEGIWQSGTIDEEPITEDSVTSDLAGGFVDKDWYHVNLEPDRTYTFDAQSLSLSTGVVFVRLYDSTGNALGSAFEAEGGAPSFTYSTAGQASSQTFYMAVSAGDNGETSEPFRTATGDFQVRYTDAGPTSPASGYTLTANFQSVDEGSQLTFTITRTGEKPDETVFFSTVKGTATYSDSDYQLEGGGLPLNFEVDFTSGQSQETVTLDILGSDGIDAGEVFNAIVQRSSSDAATTFLAESGDIMITESSTFTAYDIGPADLDVVEGGQVSLTITREGDLSPSTIYVTVLDEDTDGNDITFQGNAPRSIEVNFLDGERQSVERIAFDAVGDNVDENPERFSVVLHSDPSDPEGSVIARRDSAFIRDEEGARSDFVFVNVAAAGEPEKNEDEVPTQTLFNSPVVSEGTVTEEDDAKIPRNIEEIILQAGTEVLLSAEAVTSELEPLQIALYQTRADAMAKSNAISAIGEGNPASITVTPEDSGTYFLAVTMVDTGLAAYEAAGDYSVSINPTASGLSIGLTLAGTLQPADLWETEQNDFNDPHLGAYHLGEDWNRYAQSDFVNGEGKPIYAIGDGSIVYADSRSGYGNTVVIEHLGFGEVFYSLYAHLDSFEGGIDWPLNQQGPPNPISAGSQIGTLGNTQGGGTASSGPHLHFEIFKGDWRKYIVNGGDLGVGYHNSPEAASDYQFTYQYKDGDGGDQITNWFDPSTFIDRLNAQIVRGTDAIDDEVVFAVPNGAGGEGFSTSVRGAGSDVLVTTNAHSTPSIRTSYLAEDFETLTLLGSGSGDIFAFDPLSETSITNTTVLVDGGGGDDVINAEQVGRRIVAEGGTGSDTIIGSDQGDLLRGGDDHDVLEGGGGDDVLVGGPGTDLLRGGAGVDTAGYGSADTAVWANLRLGEGWGPVGSEARGDRLSGIENLIGSAHDDRLTGDVGNNVLEGGDGADLLRGREGTDTADYFGATAGVWVNLRSGEAWGDEGSEARGDTLSGIENLIGSAHDDRLNGDAADNVLVGGDGADLLRGRAGTDTADYSGATAGVWVNLRSGEAWGDAGSEARGDTLSGIENLIGSAHDDRLNGDTADNVLVGGDGADLLRGRAGADQLLGGLGTDTADYSGAMAGVWINLRSGNAWGDAGSEARGDTLSGIENLIGSAHDDRLNGDAADNVLVGGDGADLLRGRAGTDTADYSGATAGVWVNLRSGNAWGDAGSEARGDTLSGIEKLIGSAHDDRLNGDALANFLEGGRGDDELRGRADADTFVFRSEAFGHDVIWDWQDGLDRLDVRGAGLSYGDFTKTATGSDTLLELTTDPTQASLLFVDVAPLSIDGNDFV